LLVRGAAGNVFGAQQARPSRHVGENNGKGCIRSTDVVNSRKYCCAGCAQDLQELTTGLAPEPLVMLATEFRRTYGG
jgi:hypothetical protein